MTYIPGAGGGGVWGAITGTLSSQTDLETELEARAPLVSPTLVTPVLGAATATTINGATITSGTLNGTVTGTNTGDNSVNTLYSGLEASKLNTTAFSGLAKISVGTSTPSSPSTGDLWVDTN